MLPTSVYKLFSINLYCMFNVFFPRHLHHADFTIHLVKRHELYRQFVGGLLTRFRTQSSKAEKTETNTSGEGKADSQDLIKPEQTKQRDHAPGLTKYSSDYFDLSDGKWRLELASLTKALEPALQMCRRALVTGFPFITVVAP